MTLEQQMKWKTEKSEILFQDQWISIRSEKCRMPNGQVVEPYYVLDYSDWVNVVGITTNNEVVLVKQYRHGVGKTVMELPCGAIENKDNSALDAVKRELLEETGYSSEGFIQTGILSPNPANHSNSCYCFLATGLEQIAEPNPDLTEQLEICLVPLEQAIDSLNNGVFLQALHVSSFYYALNHLR